MNNKPACLFLIALFFVLSACAGDEELPFPVVRYGCETFANYKGLVADSLGDPEKLKVGQNSGKVYVMNRDKYKFSKYLSIFDYNGKPDKTIQVLYQVRESYFFGDFYLGKNEEIILKSLSKIKILNAEGAFIDSVKCDSTGFLSSINSRNELVMNTFSDTNMIKTFTLNGDLLKKVGKIPVGDLHVRERTRDYMGFPFELNDGRFFLFQRFLGSVKIFSPGSKQISDLRLNLPQSKEMYGVLDNPQVRRKGQYGYLVFFLDVVYRNNRFYVLNSNAADTEGIFKNLRSRDAIIYVLDTDLEIIKKILLDDEHFKEVVFSRRYEQDLGQIDFDVNREEEIFVAFGIERKILKFSPKENVR